MKGLSMTLTIVIIAIVLLVTALVVMTIFGGSMAQFIGILKPWSQGALETSLCQQKCAAYCQQNPDSPPKSWDSFTLIRKDSSGTDKPENCKIGLEDAMGTTEIGQCECSGIPTGPPADAEPRNI